MWHGGCAGLGVLYGDRPVEVMREHVLVAAAVRCVESRPVEHLAQPQRDMVRMPGIHVREQRGEQIIVDDGLVEACEQALERLGSARPVVDAGWLRLATAGAADRRRPPPGRGEQRKRDRIRRTPGR